MNEIHEAYKEDAQFFLVYTREAHPADGWQMPKNIYQGIIYDEPTTDEEREVVASNCVLNLELDLPTLIDDMDNTAATAYQTVPARIYVIGKDGKVAYASGKGPRGFRPDELESWLEKAYAD